MPHGMHPIPATAMSAVEGPLAIGADSFLAGFHPLALLLSRYLEHTVLISRVINPAIYTVIDPPWGMVI